VVYLSFSGAFRRLTPIGSGVRVMLFRPDAEAMQALARSPRHGFMSDTVPSPQPLPAGEEKDASES